jgi:hypothetical protein
MLLDLSRAGLASGNAPSAALKLHIVLFPIPVFATRADWFQPATVPLPNDAENTGK